ncbi:LacI family transcriptional regulator [Nocardioides mangrovicus]|uniref:LacI family transcriptional regulator n=1 Tax=Nocardioides mangrovicus TaxID=2478913 RepID=A0A3L8P5A8_9ACTN|nr:LacI family DNA-binding transcriptional regulator [Nocardioides mangrovicus]RLV49953.1 LacI family transcriptional regulator [Nocardioides mangrovicus]
MPTIQDVAARAGVSVATVSRFLSGQTVRSADAVREAVDALGYRPDVAAQAMRTGRHSAVGVIVPDIGNPFFAAIVKGLAQGIPDGGLHMLLASSEESAQLEARLLADLDSRVDGYVLAPVNEQDRLPLELVRRGVPVVLLDREVDGGEDCDVVLVDNAGGAASAARHLLDLGHRRIGVISGPANTTPGRERREGFLSVLAEHDVVVEPGLDLVGDFLEESGRRLTEQLLALPERPTAIFTANNQMTVGALRALQAASVPVPDEISLIGFDDLTLGGLLQPPLTCVVRDEVRQGRTVMELLVERLGHARLAETPQVPPRRVVLETTLLVRGSTATPRQEA